MKAEYVVALAIGIALLFIGYDVGQTIAVKVGL